MVDDTMISFDTRLGELSVEEHVVERVDGGIDSLVGGLTGNKGNPALTHVEHRAVAGTHDAHLGEPFTATYEEDESKKKQIKEQREEQMENRSWKYFALNLWTESADTMEPFPQSWAVYNDHPGIADHDQTRGLQCLWENATDNQFDGIDTVQAVFAPTLYDDAMRAIPQPVKLAYGSGGSVVGGVDASKTESTLNDVLTPEKGDVSTKRFGQGDDSLHVRTEREGNHIDVYGCEEREVWRETYTRRVLHALDNLYAS